MAEEERSPLHRLAHRIAFETRAAQTPQAQAFIAARGELPLATTAVQLRKAAATTEEFGFFGKGFATPAKTVATLIEGLLIGMAAVRHSEYRLLTSSRPRLRALATWRGSSAPRTTQDSHQVDKPADPLREQN